MPARLHGRGRDRACGGVPVAVMSSTMPICRWPTTEHQPLMSWPTTPASTVADSAGRQPARRLPGVEHEIVHLPVVGVGQVDDEPVARGHLDPRRGEPHAAGLHRDPGRLAGGVRAPRWRRRGDERGRVGGDPDGDGEHERGEPGRQARRGPRPVARRARPAPLAAGPRWWRVGLALRDARIPRNTSGRKPASPTRTRTEHSTRTRLGTGSTQTQQPAVDQRDPQRPAPVELGVRGAHGRGTAAEHDRDQVRQRAEQHLGAEPGCERHGEAVQPGADRGPRRRRRDGHDQRGQGCGEPGRGGEHRPGGVATRAASRARWRRTRARPATSPPR